VTLHIAMAHQATTLLVTNKAMVSNTTSLVRMALGTIDLGKTAGDTTALDDRHRMERRMARTAGAHRTVRGMALIMKNHMTKTMKMRNKRWV
jgi:hypothetical protein